jgi:hypothetical protein
VVRLCVLLQRRLVVEGHPAAWLQASVRPLPRMKSHVNLQAALRSKTLLALRAFVRLLARVPLPPEVPNLMAPSVLGQVARLSESLTASRHEALVGAFSSMNPNVLIKI